jgi:hypothetical protein
LEHCFYFPIYWEFYNPNWLSYFSEGLKPPTRYKLVIVYVSIISYINWYCQNLSYIYNYVYIYICVCVFIDVFSCLLMFIYIYVSLAME